MTESRSSSMPLMVFAWRNLWRNPKRTLILLMVFTLGIATMLIFQSLMVAWSKSMLDNALDNLTNEMQIHQVDYRDDPVVNHSFVPSRMLMNELDALHLYWTPRVIVSAMVQSEHESFPVTLIGIDPLSEKRLSFIGHSLSKGTYLKNIDSKGMLIGKKLLDRLQTKLGRRVVLMSQTADHHLGELGVRIVGVYRHSDPKVEENTVFISLNQAQTLLNLEGAIHEISMATNSKGDKAVLRSIQAQLQKKASSQLAVEPWWKLEPFIDATTEMMDQFIYIWLGFIMLLMIFGMLNTLLMSLYERHQEFRTLFRLGMQALQIRFLILIEMVWLVVLSIVAALALTWVFVWQTSGGINLHKYAEGMAWFGASQKLYIQVEASLWAEVLIATFVLILLFSLWPIWRATAYKKLQARN